MVLDSFRDEDQNAVEHFNQQCGCRMVDQGLRFALFTVERDTKTLNNFCNFSSLNRYKLHHIVLIRS